MEPLLSSDPDVIRWWVIDAYLEKLWRADGVAQDIFLDGHVYIMAYVPGIAWAIVASWKKKTPRFHYYTRPDCRRQGIATQLQTLVVAKYRGK